MPLRLAARRTRYAHLPDGWDDCWRLALAGVGSAPAYCTVFGDSITEGFAASDANTTSWFARTAAELFARYGRHSLFHGAWYSAAHGGVLNSTVFPWTLNASVTAPATRAGDGLLTTAAWTAAGSGTFLNAGSLVYVTPFACTDLDLVMWDDGSIATGGTWKYNVDNAAGGALVTVGPGSTTVNPGGWDSLYRVSLTGLSNAVHTVRFGASSITGALAAVGAVAYDPAQAKTRGVGMAMCGLAGVRMLDFVLSPNQHPVDKIGQWQGRYKTNSTTTVQTGFGWPTQPHLAIVELGINDCVGQDGFVAGGTIQFHHGLRRLIQAVRRGRDTTATGGGPCSVLIVASMNPDANNSDMTVEWANGSQWALYVEAMRSVAEAYGCGFLDVHAAWGETPVASGYVASATDAHPSDAGHLDYAARVLELIG